MSIGTVSKYNNEYSQLQVILSQCSCEHLILLTKLLQITPVSTSHFYNYKLIQRAIKNKVPQLMQKTRRQL